MNTKDYLDHYRTIEDVEVVYHPHERISWGRNRKIYDGVFDMEYNHRSILTDEVVFDFDDESKKKNEDNANEVCKRLESRGVKYSLWSSGNKGFHIHTMWFKLHTLSNISSMKKVILQHFAGDFKIDYQLATKHLIRAEGGLNEKDLVHLKTKKLIKEDEGLVPNMISPYLMKLYADKMKEDAVRMIAKSNDSEVDNKKLKRVLNGEIKVQDGREKILFFAIHQLKKSHEFEEVCSVLCSWYRYSGGCKMSNSQIKQKVKYHWNKDYSFKKDFLDEFIPKE